MNIDAIYYWFDAVADEIFCEIINIYFSWEMEIFKFSTAKSGLKRKHKKNRQKHRENYVGGLHENWNRTKYFQENKHQSKNNSKNQVIQVWNHQIRKTLGSASDGVI